MRRLAIVAACLFACAAQAIEVPKPQPVQEQPPAPAPPPLNITPTDETAFYEKLQRVTHYRNLLGLHVPETAIAELGRGNADAAVAALSGAANQGNNEANIALVRIQHWCNSVSSQRAGDPQTQIAKFAKDMPPQRASRIAGVIHAELDYLQRARAGCGKAGFDYQGIEGRLRQSAEAGNPASATELAQYLRDPNKREAMLQSAVKKNYAPAMHKAATNLLMAVQRGQTTENVSAIRDLLKVAGRTIPRAKVDLANCMAVGCDGHPADALTAHAFGIDAARDGEPTAFLSMMRMPWGGRMTRAQLLAWQYFGDRLNEAGCMGDAFIPTTVTFAQTIQLLEKGQNPKALEDAHAQAESLWKDNGARAMKEDGCG
jgi:hypothetical protein